MGLAMAFNFKTATPDTSIASSAFMFGADSQSSSTPSIYQMSVVKTFMSDSPTLVTPNIGVATGTSLNLSSSKFIADTVGNLSLTRGVLAAGSDGAFTGTFTDGLVLDYVSPTARFSAGTTDGFGWYNGGVGATTLMTLSSGSALTLGVQQTTQGSVVLANTAAGAFSTTLKASNSASAAWTLTLPTTAGTNNYWLKTDGSGNTSWTNSISTATGTSLALNGATLGTNNFAVTGTSYLNGKVGIGANPSASAQLDITYNRSAISYAFSIDAYNGASFENSLISFFDGAKSVLGNYQNFPFALYANNTEAMRIDGSKNVVVGTAAISTSATDGFLYLPTCAGSPTGVATAYTGRSPIVVDTTNNRLYINIGGTWKYAVLI